MILTSNLRTMAESGSSKTLVLLLAANPLGKEQLDLDGEIKAVTAALRRGHFRDDFEAVPEVGAGPEDLVRAVRDRRPAVVHFCGHAEVEGLYFRSADGSVTFAPAAALRAFFGRLEGEVRVLFLNACLTAAQAETLSEHISFVVGMTKPVEDEAARRLAEDFYSGLADGLSVGEAFDRARSAAELRQDFEVGVCQLFHRPEVKPDAWVLSRNARLETALRRFRELLGRLEVREALSRQRLQLEETNGAMRAMARAKQLHDALHNFYFGSFRIMESLLGMPPAALDWSLLDGPVLQLEGLAERLRVQTGEEWSRTDWLVSLEESVGPLRAAAAPERDEVDLEVRFATFKRTTGRLRSLLRVQLPRINQELVLLARRLDLGPWVDGLTQVTDTLKAGAPGQGEVARLQEAVMSLRTLGDELRLRVDAHDRWQQLDNRFGLSESDPSELEYSWPDLKSGIEALCRGVNAPWAAPIREETARLDEELPKMRANLERNGGASMPGTGAGGIGVRRRLLSLRARVGNRFHDVDLELKSHTDRFAHLVGPLDRILEDLTHVAA